MARPIAKDHDDKRAHILAGAAKLFAEQGYVRSSVASVAKACGISKANIYHYYDSKDAVLFGILDSYLRGLRDRVCGLDIDGLTADRALYRTVAEILRAYQGADHEHRVQINAMSALPEDQQNPLRAYQRDLVAHLSRILKRVSPSLGSDPARLRATTMSVFGMLNWFYMWHPNANNDDRIAYARTVANLTLKGISGYV